MEKKTWWTNSNVRFDNQSHLFDNRFHQLSDRNFGHKEHKKTINICQNITVKQFLGAVGNTIIRKLRERRAASDMQTQCNLIYPFTRPARKIHAYLSPARLRIGRQPFIIYRLNVGLTQAA